LRFEDFKSYFLRFLSCGAGGCLCGQTIWPNIWPMVTLGASTVLSQLAPAESRSHWSRASCAPRDELGKLCIIFGQERLARLAQLGGINL